MDMNQDSTTSSGKRPLISVVVPVYNEADVLSEFNARLSSALDSIPFDAEVIYVNDGSSDQTLTVLISLQQIDARLQILDLSRNFGKEIALTAGLDYSHGEATIVIDADLQDPPEIIPKMIDLWQQGNDVVYAKRTSRAGDSILKKLTAFLFYRALRRITNIDVPEDTGDFRLLSRRAVNAVKALREQHRFMKGLFAWVGFKQVGIEYEREQRFAGNTKWNYWKLWNFALEGITSFTTLPLKVSSYLGTLTALGAFIYGIVIVFKTVIYGQDVPGYPSLMVVILFLGGIQLMAIGILGEYVGRSFEETKRRPLYLLNAVYAEDTSQLENSISQAKHS